MPRLLRLRKALRLMRRLAPGPRDAAAGIDLSKPGHLLSALKPKET
tara:strand:- start:1075 stop:1212 length:138 start_codon:yes stop_codon:yes gene_type:complete